MCSMSGADSNRTCRLPILYLVAPEILCYKAITRTKWLNSIDLHSISGIPTSTPNRSPNCSSIANADEALG